jgi:hypothetical protein
MPWSLSFTVIIRSLYAVIVGWVLVAEPPWGAGEGRRREPFICAAICAQVVVAFRVLLKLVALNDVMLNFIEFLMTITFFCMFCVHLTAF